MYSYTKKEMKGMGKMIKKKQIAALVLAGTMAMGSSMQAFACMGVYVGKEVSENGSSYIGRSEDIGAGHTKIFTVHPAEDLTQETFLKLFKNLSGYKGKKKFKAYLYTIANHLCIDESRKVEFYPLEDEENIVHEYNDIVRLEDRAEISYFLNFLSPEQREAVILRFGEQLSFGEIAKVMGCNMRTAQSRVRNALKIMRKEQENER